MFGLEQRASGYNGVAWVCVAPDAASGKMNVGNWGYFGSLDVVVREPTSTDRNFILANSSNFIALDPVTLQQTTIGALAPTAQYVIGGTVFELMPEHIPEILLNTSVIRCVQDPYVSSW